jgi:hypothetical protein
MSPIIFAAKLIPAADIPIRIIITEIHEGLAIGHTDCVRIAVLGNHRLGWGQDIKRRLPMRRPVIARWANRAGAHMIVGTVKGKIFLPLFQELLLPITALSYAVQLCPYGSLIAFVPTVPKVNSA